MLAVVVKVPDVLLGKSKGCNAGHGLFPQPVEYLQQPSSHFSDRQLLGYMGVVSVKLVQGVVDNQPTDKVDVLAACRPGRTYRSV